jgi:hypothetical protein
MTEWYLIEGATTQPHGKAWFNNRKSRFAPGYESILMDAPAQEDTK